MDECGAGAPREVYTGCPDDWHGGAEIPHCICQQAKPRIHSDDASLWWCHDCGGLTEAPDVEDLDEEIKA